MQLSKLTALASEYSRRNPEKSHDLPGLSIYRRDAISEIEALIYEPVMCLILQGSKVTSIGDQHAELHPGDALLVSHDLPVVSRITKASRQEPYTALILSLDLGLVRSLYDQVADTHLHDHSARSLSVCRADPAWIAPLIRYLNLMNSPRDAAVLGPSTLREIHYRLLLSPIGRMLRRLLIADSHANRIAKAIQTLRAGFRSPLSVADLASGAGMSTSSFHAHFKSITGTTPLQYQKDLRLIEARSLLLDRHCPVSETAYAVGYESPTHFSRDYSKKFGVPPSRDANLASARDQHPPQHASL
ncbi:AraC family transcriptional regulator [Rhodobacteraceae bacterium D3-12]|nr:AraC family transcriptional regulator [Rhodobacteraceae bacterium D3-12]